MNFIRSIPTTWYPGFLVSWLIVLLGLAGCSTLAPDSSEQTRQITDVSVTDEWLGKRQQQLLEIAYWQINARFSLVTDDEAWSGKLDWRQQSNLEYLIHFSDPAGQGAMQLLGNEHWVELRLANGDFYRAKDADELLKKETDWELPISSLWHWVRALPDPKMSLSGSELDSRDLPVKIKQNGWIVNYHSYHQVDQRSFPRKMIVEKDGFKLKLIIMNWLIE